MKVFRQDIKIIATAYVVAESADEARDLLAEHATDVGHELREEGIGDLVRGVEFARLIEEVVDGDTDTRVTLSPAVTLLAPMGDLEEVDD